MPGDADPGLPAATRVGQVTLRVTDLEGVQAFYEETVGLVVRGAGPDRCALGTGEETLVVLQRDPDAGERPRDAAGLFHLAVRVPSRADLGDVLERLERADALRGASDHGVSEALYAADPEGNGVEVYRDRPRSAWPVADDGSVRMDTRPLDLGSVREVAAGRDAVPHGTTVGHVHLEVTDLERARTFYVEGLGMAVRHRRPQAVFVAAGDYHHHVALNTWNRRTEPASGRGLSSFAVVVPGADAVDAAGRRLEGVGATLRETEGGLAVTDPDGVDVHLRVADEAGG